MKAKKPKTINPIPADLDEFQVQYGAEWLSITKSPAFLAGMQLLNVRKLKGLTALTDEQIEKNGREILSDLRGHLQHEEDLLTLHDKREFRFPVEEETEYLSPEAAAEMERTRDNLIQEQRKRRYHAT